MVLLLWVGRVPEWSNGADCKSAIRGFESHPDLSFLKQDHGQAIRGPFLPSPSGWTLNAAAADMQPTSPNASPGMLAVRTAALDLYESLYPKGGSRVAAYAPGRVNIIGEHIDYTGGFVMPMAIGRGTVCVASLGEGGVARVASAQTPGNVVEFSLAGLSPGVVTGWGAYIAGEVKGCLDQRPLPPGLNLSFASDLPVGAGLSSSAALEVSAALAVDAILGVDRPRVDVARLCRRAERDYAGVPCGIMDQYIACMAEAEHALFIDCVSEQHRLVRIPPEVTFVIADSGKRHELTAGEYADRRASCERALDAIRKARDPYRHLRHCTFADLGVPGIDPVDRKRARHSIGECARVLAAEQAFGSRRWAQAGDLMRQSHASLRDDYEVSCDELNTLADRLNAMPGVHGARLTGAGFGGCVVALVHESLAAEIAEELRSSGASPMVVVSRPAGAATVLPG